jgi:hypothetical protein
MTKLMKLSVIALLTGTLALVGCGDDETSGTGGSAATGGSGGTGGGTGGAGGGTGGTGGAPILMGCPALEDQVSSTNIVTCQVEAAPGVILPVPVAFITYATTLGQDFVVDAAVDVTTCVDIIIDPSVSGLVIGLMAQISAASLTLGVTNADPPDITHTIPGLPIPVTEAVSMDEVTTAETALAVGDVVIDPTEAIITLSVPGVGDIDVIPGEGDCSDFVLEGDPITFQAI